MRQETLDKTYDDPRGTPARILDAAEEVFAEHGFAGASTREIAKRATVPFGAIHYHWGSKRQLWQAVMKRLAERIRATLIANLAPASTPAQLLDHITDAFVDLLVANRNYARLACRTYLEATRDNYVEQVFDDLGRFGLGLLDDMAPGTEVDGLLTVHVVSNAFVAVLVDEAGQQACIGESIFTSPTARERVRAELKRLARAMFRIPER